MAFELTIEADEWRADVFRRGNAFLVVVNFGYDPLINHTYSAVVGLEPLQGGDMEHFFFIIDADNANGTETTYYSGLQTVGLFPKETRNLVLKLVLSATKSLLDTAQPAQVRRFTWDANPPEKALVKHLAVAEVFETCGYAMRTSDVYHGRYVWWAEREIGSGVS